jgi:hypothetical protein
MSKMFPGKDEMTRRPLIFRRLMNFPLDTFEHPMHNQSGRDVEQENFPACIRCSPGLRSIQEVFALAF